MRVAPILIAGAGALIVAAAPERGSKVEKETLWAAISVARPIFEEGAASEPLMIHFALVNDGDKVVDPDVESSHLLINGEEPEDWPMTIGNGPRDDRFHALSPGDSILFGYDLHDHFRKPGIYKVSWKGKGFKAAEVEFRVLPRRRE